MHLWSGYRLGIGKPSSLAMSQGSEAQPQIAQREQEIEVGNSSSFESNSMSELGDMYHFDKCHEPDSNVSTSQADATPSYQMEFNIKLKYDYTNAWDAEIYHDLMQRQVYKTNNCLTPFEKSPWVNYQGDMYVEDDGSR